MKQGPATFGSKHKATHKICRRCGEHSFHIAHGICAGCGFGKTAKIKKYSWQTKKKGGKVRK
ncbi:MAG: 50S ribosomal protein L37e [Candidatus Huberarchaeum crystalense]|uniref:Large ribosomal subunit protein eL37 n=1 Tax=Huberarchaeum crystalense TaxID=2014257 RepID=A0A2G9LJA7_HUBC1|nr:50S ribosomal protein L37e [archaeon]OIP20810.1 MAG: 50S ribosomal protein L37e [archaeon CG2_30_31_98]PIN66633.1 MAG: 50S ribosomal protein L37e [Candidatus Huberarchaeum crystalense]NCS98496.1 50S ribosomal protein L37e [archaeon]PIV13495.1 MAG: 50S ribosomal protein L37e [Candidatus Huberarchaeum crystalense]